MDDDSIVRDRVAAELDFDPSVRASGLGVAARRGIVTLFGWCPSHADKLGAIRAAHRVEGVRGVAVDVVVRMPADLVHGDYEIADELAAALATKRLSSGVRVTVENGSVTLHGCVNDERQRREIEAIARKLRSVITVTNTLHLACDQRVIDIRERLLAAFMRNSALASAGISIEVTGAAVTLSGAVPTHLLAKDAEAAAWGIPGVTAVRNLLKVG
jgi:osmotically-inducible protein OsmY